MAETVVEPAPALRSALVDRLPFRFEDVLLFCWLLIHPLFFDPASGVEFLEPSAKLGAVAGGLYITATLAALVCVATRNPNERITFRWSSDFSPRAFAPAPFIVALGLIAAIGVDAVGFADGRLAFAVVFPAAIVFYVFYERLPVLPALARRALITPSILICAGISDAILLETLREVDWSELEATLVGALLVVPLVFFVLFLFAPRQLADSEGTWTEWAWRFILYLVAAIPSTALLSTCSTNNPLSQLATLNYQLD